MKRVVAFLLGARAGLGALSCAWYSNTIYMFACLEFCSTWTSDGLLYVVFGVAVSSPRLRHCS